MLGLTLLERLSEYEINPEKRGIWDALSIEKSVLTHLNKILNTKQGNSLSSPDLGMPDYTNMPGNFDLETFGDLEKTITEVVEKYEPRLKNVKIQYMPDENTFLAMKFKIDGEINLERMDLSISLETVIDPEGKINISN